MTTADLFTQPAENSQPDALAQATKHGATFEQRGADWFAIAKKRGRPMALASFAAGSQAATAAMYCTYFNLRHTT